MGGLSTLFVHTASSVFSNSRILPELGPQQQRFCATPITIELGHQRCWQLALVPHAGKSVSRIHRPRHSTASLRPSSLKNSRVLSIVSGLPYFSLKANNGTTSPAPGAQLVCLCRSCALSRGIPPDHLPVDFNER